VRQKLLDDAASNKHSPASHAPAPSGVRKGKSMTCIDKLYTQLLADPRQHIAFRDFEKLLRAFGFEHVRTKGSHTQYVHPKVPRPLPVQPESKHAKRYQIRQFLEFVEEYSLYMCE
jgi:predicted RNA binding protein YcfA (HicA-like mRNA interferase family)